MNHTITLVAGKVALGATLALGFLAAPHASAAHADTLGHYDAYAAEVGDDNGDGIVMETRAGGLVSITATMSAGPTTSGEYRPASMTSAGCSWIPGPWIPARGRVTSTWAGTTN